MIKATGRRWSTEYKEPVIAVLVRRALEQCAKGESPKSSTLAKVGRAVPSAPRRTAKTAIVGISSQTRGALGTARPTAEIVITTTINGRSHTLTTPANRTLLDLLRDQLGLLGTKCGCEIGECGACTVLLDGEPVNSCLVLAPQIDGRQVVTVEGLAQDGNLHPLQESFLDHDAVHCGFCTPGMLLSAKALLDWNPRPTEKEIRTAISGNLCRCTGYQQIVQAITKAGK
jgi:carbon-monoxide dehydrogenase small subunit